MIYEKRYLPEVIEVDKRSDERKPLEQEQQIKEKEENVPKSGTSENQVETTSEIQKEIKVSKKQIKPENFHITDYQLGNGTTKEKYRRNVDAIRLLKKLEQEQRQADKFEQETLSNYVGWGGLSEVFDVTKTSWINEYNELKELLTESEYKAARESVLNAHFTQPVIIESIYDALEHAGINA